MHYHFFLFLPSFNFCWDPALTSTIFYHLTDCFDPLQLQLYQFYEYKYTKRSCPFILLKIIYACFFCFSFYFFSFHILISSISLVLISFGKFSSIDFRYCWFSSGFKTFKASTSFLPWSSIIFTWFSKDFPQGV